MEGHGGDLCDDDSSEGVGGGGIDSLELHLKVLGVTLDQLDAELLFESGVVEDLLVLFVHDDFFFLELEDILWMHSLNNYKKI